MSTHAHTYVVDQDEDVYLVMYTHWDGYPKYHGMALARFLEPIKMVVGLMDGYELLPVANGAGCLAAQILAHFKRAPGDHYLVIDPVQNYKDKDDCVDYHYVVRVDKEEAITIACFDSEGTRLRDFCSPQEFMTWAQNRR